MKPTSPNRAVLLTPPGPAAIAVIRLTGPAVGDFLRAYFSRGVRESVPTHGTLSDGANVIDDPLVVTSRDGTVADLNLHGGPWVVRATLDLARRAGFDVTEAATLPLPDDAADGDSPLEREVYSHLPLARTELAVRALLAQPLAWDRLRKDTSSRTRSEIAGAVRQILDDSSLRRLLHPPRVAIVGAPNVGKSTLANQLFAQERSITADVPGTTRDWVGEIANVDGLAVMLLDTPGIREASDAIERAAIQRSGEEIGGADLVVLVLDAARPLDPEQSVLVAEYPNALIVENKCDREVVWEMNNPGTIRTVATTGVGVDVLRREILHRFGCRDYDGSRPRCWTSRQHDILLSALTNLDSLARL
jgi:tRNA modification GTPase